MDLGLLLECMGCNPKPRIALRSFILLRTGAAAMDHDRGLLNSYGCQCWCKAGLVDGTSLIAVIVDPKGWRLKQAHGIPRLGHV